MATNIVVMRAVVDVDATPVIGRRLADTVNELNMTPSPTVKPDDPWGLDGASATTNLVSSTTTTTAIPAAWPSPGKTPTLNPKATEYKPWSAPYVPKSPTPGSPPIPSAVPPATSKHTPVSDANKNKDKKMTTVQPGADWKSPRMAWDTGSATGKSLVNGKEHTEDAWGNVSNGPWDDPAPAASGVDGGWGLGNSGGGGSGGGDWVTQGGGRGGGGGGKGKKQNGQGNNGNGSNSGGGRGGRRGGGRGGGNVSNAGGGRNAAGSSGLSKSNTATKAPAKAGWADDVSAGPW